MVPLLITTMYQSYKLASGAFKLGNNKPKQVTLNGFANDYASTMYLIHTALTFAKEFEYHGDNITIGVQTNVLVRSLNTALAMPASDLQTWCNKNKNREWIPHVVDDINSLLEGNNVRNVYIKKYNNNHSYVMESKGVCNKVIDSAIKQREIDNYANPNFNDFT